jgi:hypothetical protein
MTEMTESQRAAAPPAHWLTTTHWLLAGQSLVILLITANRLGPWTQGYAAQNEFLRWLDLHNMLSLPMISVVFSFALWLHLEELGSAASGRARLLVSLAFGLGLYLFGAGYGAHEVTNYLHERYCTTALLDADLCRIVIFNDDSFSHWVFYAGYLLVAIALMAKQVLHPWPGGIGRRDNALLVGNALFIALGIFGNLAFEEIGMDLYAFGGLALLAIGLLWRNRGQPILCYQALSNGLGVLATLVYMVLK